MKLFLHKLFHWEYWPFQLVYVPIYLLWIWYALKSKSLFFFNACNPTIKNGGFFNESKKEIYDLMPPFYYPKTSLIKTPISFEKLLEIKESQDFDYPFIVKPDVGLRGSAVKKIEDENSFFQYWQKAQFDFLIQDFIPFPHEIGVFYVRFPSEKQGKLTGIVAKEFLEIEGNGIDTVRDLILKNPRFAIQLQVLEREFGNQILKILPKGEKQKLVPYGNHARGAKFLDCSHWISPNLTNVIDQICLQIDGFYFGRIDLMYDNLSDLEAGKNFSIVEINGAGSEPTHIYDPRHSIFFAWKELSRHITMMYQISAQNHQNGIPFLSFSEGVKEFRLHNEQNKKITNF